MEQEKDKELDDDSLFNMCLELQNDNEKLRQYLDTLSIKQTRIEHQVFGLDFTDEEINNIRNMRERLANKDLFLNVRKFSNCLNCKHYETKNINGCVCKELISKRFAQMFRTVLYHKNIKCMFFEKKR